MLSESIIRSEMNEWWKGENSRPLELQYEMSMHRNVFVFRFISLFLVAFTGLTLLVGHQEHPPIKN